MIVSLAGGVGAARFLDGLVRLLRPEELFIVGNTGDDAEIHGLHISPDLDTVVYTLAGLANAEHGWGIRGDTFHCLQSMGQLGEDTWFQLGDRDFATHLWRSNRLREGWPLSRITKEMGARLGVRSTVTPMCDEPVRTMVNTPVGELEFQEYFVKRRARDKVLGVLFRNSKEAKPAPGVLKAIGGASGIIFCPSNPIISIGPILSVPGIRKALEKRKCRSAAISPIVGGKALKGPAAGMMASMGNEVSARGVARLYQGLVDVFVLDREDRKLAPAIDALGMRTVVTNTIMTGLAEKKALARSVLKALENE